MADDDETTEPKSNGASNGSAEWADWPTQTEAELLSGSSARTIARAGADGKIRRLKDDEGRWRYNPDDLEDMEPAPRGRPRDAERAPGAEVIEESFKGGTTLLKVTQHHLEKVYASVTSMLDTVREVVRDANKPLREENTELRARCRELESAQVATIRAREELLDEKHQRDLETKIELEREARRGRMAKVFEDRAPGLLDKILGANSEDLAKAGIAVQFLKSFDPTLVEVMLEGDFLNAEQKELLRRLLGKQPNEAKAKAEAKPTVETTGEPAPEPEPAAAEAPT